MTVQVDAAPTAAAKGRTYAEVRQDGKAIEDRLRKLSKECLLLAAAHEIAWTANYFHSGDDTARRAYIERKCNDIEEWVGSARMVNRTKRLNSFLERIKNPQPKRRRRRRRKAWHE